MKKSLLTLAASAALFFVAGCDTGGTSARIAEKTTVYNSLAPWQQRDIQDGVVSIGGSTDMVYMALGKPSKIVTSADGSETTWTYNNYFPASARSHAQASVNSGVGSGHTTGVDSSSSPRNTRSLSDTSTKGTTQTNLDVAELPSDTLYVIFKDGQVYQTKLESEGK
ncbi:MAG: hypothetical protein JWM35_644 [Verrucomicrobia bacterium]|nr:hypothetical protein [Verrucomicrobiota bacterium]